MDEEWVKSRLVPRDAFSNKGSFGRLLVIAGSAHYSGAAMMATRAATRTGAGLTTLCSTKEVCQSLAGAIPEASKLPLKSDENGFIAFGEEEKLAQALLRAKAVVLGCGLGQTAGARALCQYVLKHAACPVLLDADGINCICADINILKKLATQVVITPHPGEMARMLGTTVEQVQQNRIQSALTFAKEYGVHVVLKGRYTLIVSPQGEMMLNTNGNPGLAKGGSGDVLAGVIGSLLAPGARAF